MYELVFKRHAPFATFGGGFHGDNRQGPKLDGTARTAAVVEFASGKPILNHFGYSGESYHVKPEET
jgi:hypothetical protein